HRPTARISRAPRAGARYCRKLKNTDMAYFLHDNFLLQSDVAERLYHDYAKSLPIIDYHSHLPPEAIATNGHFRNLTHVWLAGDHYKWRAQRVLGISEQYITGNADDREKFRKWAEAVPYTLDRKSVVSGNRVAQRG